ncbi:MAG: primosomal protein N' [Candidatus Dormibacteraeota bacterium]|nr:primosomal protein N' [Candidatus Dormibacteraeota bacterium]
MLYADVAVEAGRALDHETYTYAVPPGLEVVPGHRVWVPFGRRGSYGFVVSLSTEEPGLDVREIERADPEALLLPHHVALAREVARHYWAPLIECLRTMLPPRVRGARRSSGAGPSSRQTRFSRLLEHTRPAGPAEPPPPLTLEQAAAMEMIRGERATLLLGVAASGKTELYLGAAADALAAGLRVLVLVPEISLSPQLVQRFSRRLGVPLAVLHSGLTELERAQQWWRARRGDVDLVIGSRSAVFAPLPRLGLVVLDEEGSSAYKQDRTPRYETSWVARRLAALTSAHLILGSATPTVATYAEAESGGLALARLPQRVSGRPAAIEMVDMRAEPDSGPTRPLSRRLQWVVAEALADGGQAILFLNRRGAATFLLCRDCGSSVECPGCSVSMVEHPELGGLHCHYCGYTTGMPVHCPSCGSRRLQGRGVGTQRLETAAGRLWPAARVLRLDRDSARGPDAYLDVLEAFAEHRADILVGTQLVARGLDLEGVTAVGVVDADVPLRFPDYRSAETAYALVAQVAGRAGRRGQPARVVVQTSNPDHYSLRHVLAGDYDAFARHELASRRIFDFPPASDLAVLTFAHADDEVAARTAREAADELASRLVRDGIGGIRVQGPAPAFLHRLRGEHRWQLTLRGRDLDRARLLAPRGRGWSYDVDPGP